VSQAVLFAIAAGMAGHHYPHFPLADFYGVTQ
jgi:hypothetical protein